MVRRKSDPLCEEVKAFLDLSPQQWTGPETWAHWQTLWQQQFAGEKMRLTDAGCASIMTDKSVYKATESGDYKQALVYLDTFLAHPQAGAVGVEGLIHLRCNRMLCLLHTGDEAQALEIGRALLAFPRPTDLRTAQLLLQGPLYTYLLQNRPEQMASANLTAFIEAVAQATRPRKRKRLPDTATFRQLSEILNQTRPPAERERLKRVYGEEAQRRNGRVEAAT